MSGGLFLCFDGTVEVLERVVEILHLKIEQSPEEVQTRLLVILAAIIDGFIQELLGLKNLLIFNLLVDEVAAHRVRVRAHNRDHLQAVRVLIFRELPPGLREKLACHQVIFMVHSQDALAQPFVVSCGSVDLAELGHFLYVFLGHFILLYRYVAIGSEQKDLVNQIVGVGFVRVALLSV